MTETTKKRIEISLPSDLEIAMTREFDAPRDLVFEAHANPDHIRQWWGRTGNELIVDQFDFRVGGKWRLIERQPDGFEHIFRGEFREIERPVRITQTFEYEGYPGHISVETMELEEAGGRTIFRGISRFDTREDRDGMLESGMEVGANESFDNLDQFLAGNPVKGVAA